MYRVELRKQQSVTFTREDGSHIAIEVEELDAGRVRIGIVAPPEFQPRRGGGRVIKFGRRGGVRALKFIGARGEIVQLGIDIPEGFRRGKKGGHLQQVATRPPEHAAPALAPEVAEVPVDDLLLAFAEGVLGGQVVEERGAALEQQVYAASREKMAEVQAASLEEEVQSKRRRRGKRGGRRHKGRHGQSNAAVLPQTSSASLPTTRQQQREEAPAARQEHPVQQVVDEQSAPAPDGQEEDLVAASEKQLAILRQHVEKRNEQRLR